MTKYVTPEDAVHTLKRHLHSEPWFKGATLTGVGPDAAIELHSSSLAEATGFVVECGGRWEGYPILIRRAS